MVGNKRRDKSGTRASGEQKENLEKLGNNEAGNVFSRRRRRKSHGAELPAGRGRVRGPAPRASPFARRAGREYNFKVPHHTYKSTITQKEREREREREKERERERDSRMEKALRLFDIQTRRPVNKSNEHAAATDGVVGVSVQSQLSELPVQLKRTAVRAPPFCSNCNA
ncbi:hypothetical protein EVAR_75831_1 [Eumeta japonica]|uniref:Uncharacterized protein n=1 Tax=Eumeta variegata TaxID=151549 RepID=A0A4C1TDX4_EUMVA|nr:hypothetical protein EVAR_75831_1 [Eumeta japonica]